MFNLKEFIINNLIKGVKNKSFSKEYASILATNYFLKGIISEEDLARFDLETTETVEAPVEDTEVIEENVEQTTEKAEESTTTEDNVEVV